MTVADRWAVLAFIVGVLVAATLPTGPTTLTWVLWALFVIFGLATLRAQHIIDRRTARMEARHGR